jgi:hypothetical protein
VTTYETREQWLNAFIDAARPQFIAANAPLPINVRISMGFTSKGAGRAKGGKVIGECWASEASGDNHFEIFVTPTLADTARVCDVLTHELIHVAVGIKSGHGVAFKRVAASLGLTGKATHTVAGEEWYKWALPIIDALGPMPYAALTAGENSGRKKQKTSLLKVECTACGFLARVTAKHLAPYPFLNCPVPDCVGSFICEDIDGEGEPEE